jgi:hypothetical protein
MKLFEELEYLLLKFTTDEYFQGITDGQLFFSKASEFITHATQGIQGDKNEFINMYLSTKECKVELLLGPDKDNPIHKLDASKIAKFMSIRGGQDNHKFIFCCTGIHYRDLETMKGMKLDQRFREFGNRVIVVTDFKQFIDRITKAANNIGAELEHRRVEYKKSETLVGLTPFNKLDKFSWQYEYRFILELPESNSQIKDKTFILDIGNISDICTSGYTHGLTEYGFKIKQV